MNITFNEAIDNFLNYLQFKFKYSTYSSNKYRIYKYILPYFNNKNIYTLTKKEYLNWQYEIEKLNFKYNYKSSLHCTFSNFLNYCVIYYDLDSNIAQIVGNFRNNQLEEDGNIWTIEDFKKFISVVDNDIYSILFKLLYFTGMRKGELLALTWNDIDFINNKIHIYKTISKEVVNGKHLIYSTKTKRSNRIIYIDSFLLHELMLIKNKINCNDDDLIFKISFSHLKRKKDYYCDKANVKNIKIHEFRHSHAYLLFNNNVPIDEISYRLGHSKISMTMDVYLRFMPINEKNVISTFSSLLNI